MTPTPSPTPTPTPTPSEINLNVPLIKQSDDPWQSQEYDTAHLWNSISTTIHDWGCALTSAVMALQYNGITKMPDNTPLDPASLNAWLKSQPDGYIGNGLVNWLAIPRLTRLAKLSFNNPDFTSDALEYKRIQGNSNESIAADLKNGLPDILEEPGHFIIAKGTQGSTFTINDPYYDRSLLTDTYNNSFLHAGKFVPSHTDLSYLMFTGSQSLSFD
ncbi:MAG TPA: C39 family peptidase, partial [Patescibacteria group bacterium]